MSLRKNAEDVLHVQLPSYRVEAELIGSYEIPPLIDTVDTLQQSGEIFFGYYLEEELCGVISIKVYDNEVDLHRLFVHPKHFRKGMAQRLLDVIENKFEVETIKVTTGSKNNPAISFYKKNGFHPIKKVAINKQLFITFFEKRM